MQTRNEKHHPPQPPFLRKGEKRRLRDAGGITRRDERAAKDGRTGAQHQGWLLARSITPFGTKGVAPTARGDVTRSFVLALALLAFASGPALAAVGPNIHAVQPDHLDDYWVLANYSTLAADVPNSGTNLSKPTCSAVSYMIGSDGVTRDIVVRKTIPAGDLKSAAASLVKNMRYAAGAKNAMHEPVFTYIIVPFNLPANKAERQKITDACVLKDFPQGYR